MGEESNQVSLGRLLSEEVSRDTGSLSQLCEGREEREFTKMQNS